MNWIMVVTLKNNENKDNAYLNANTKALNSSKKTKALLLAM